MMISLRNAADTMLAEVVAEWNRDNPPGTPVWLTDDHGQRHETVTRSIAWVLPNGIPLVMVHGRTGGYLLERIEARPCP